MQSNDTRPLCACGCGEHVKTLVARFCRGHNNFARPDDVAERLWSRVTKTTDCWPISGSNQNGYGVIRVRGVYIKATHAAWYLAEDEPVARLPRGAVIGHTCDNPPCVRNDDRGTYEVDGIEYERHGHLWLATTGANQRDMVNKGRSLSGHMSPAMRHPETLPRGERHGRAKLTAEDVIAMRRMRAARMSYSKICNHFSISPRPAWQAINGKTWAHVEPSLVSILQNSQTNLQVE